MSLFQDGCQKACKRYQNGCSTDPYAGAAANVRVLGFCLIGRYIDDIVLAQVVIGRYNQLCIIKIQIDNLTLAFCILTNQFHIVTDAINGHISAMARASTDIYLFISYGKSTRTVHLSQYRNFVICHTDCNDRTLFQIGLQLLTDQIFRLVFVRPPTFRRPITGKSISPLLFTRYCWRVGCVVVLILVRAAFRGVCTVRLKGAAA